MHAFSKIGVVACIASTLFANQMNAVCPRCIQIEKQRALEQSQNGQQPIRYYNDDREISALDSTFTQGASSTSSTGTSGSTNTDSTSLESLRNSSSASPTDRGSTSGSFSDRDTGRRIYGDTSSLRNTTFDSSSSTTRGTSSFGGSIDTTGRTTYGSGTDATSGRSFQTGTSRDRSDFQGSFGTSSTDTTGGNFQTGTSADRSSFNTAPGMRSSVIDGSRVNADTPTYSGTRANTYYNPETDIYIRGDITREVDSPRGDRLSGSRYYLEDEGIPADQAYSTVYAILQSRDFLKTLNGPFTLFIPSNEALRRLPPGTLHSLLRPENQDRLANLVGSHLVARRLTTADLTNQSNASTVNGTQLNIRSDSRGLTINGARVIRSESVGNNGMIYIVDNLLFPQF